MLDFTVVENGSDKETEVHVCAADVGTTRYGSLPTIDRQSAGEGCKTKAR